MTKSGQIIYSHFIFQDRHSSESEDVRKCHEKEFKEIGEAKGVLSDAKKRASYDHGHETKKWGGGYHHFPFG